MVGRVVIRGGASQERVIDWKWCGDFVLGIPRSRIELRRVYATMVMPYLLSSMCWQREWTRNIKLASYETLLDEYRKHIYREHESVDLTVAGTTNECHPYLARDISDAWNGGGEG